MKPSELELINLKKWVKTWKEASIVLDQISSEELSQLSENDSRQKINIIFGNLGESFYARRASSIDSGLVDMQKLFSKLKVNE
jgi:hypothetical protein